MIDWSPEALTPDVPLYVAIADALARDLEAGRLRAGQRLPTHRALARRLGVNVMTVTRGYAEAARRGLVEGEVGRGTFVRAQGRPANDFQPLEEDGRRLVDFHFNLPAGAPSILEVEEALGAIAREGGAPLFHGYSAAGLEEHRAAGAAWLERGGATATPERVLVTGGGQHAMTLAFRALTSPGDLVLTEELTSRAASPSCASSTASAPASRRFQHRARHDATNLRPPRPSGFSIVPGTMQQTFDHRARRSCAGCAVTTAPVFRARAGVQPFIIVPGTMMKVRCCRGGRAGGG